MRLSADDERIMLINQLPLHIVIGAQARLMERYPCCYAMIDGLSERIVWPTHEAQIKKIPSLSNSTQ